MKQIKPNTNPEQWPRTAVASVEARKRDLIIRISDWTRQSLEAGEPAYDVEVYIGGVYDWNESKTFTLREYSNLRRSDAKINARHKATEYAQQVIARLL